MGDTDAKALRILCINKTAYPNTGLSKEPPKEEVAGITANLCAVGINLHINTPKEDPITPAEQDPITPAEQDPSNQLLEAYKDVFQDIGLLRGDRVKFYIDHSVPTVAAPYLPTPLAY